MERTQSLVFLFSHEIESTLCPFMKKKCRFESIRFKIRSALIRALRQAHRMGRFLLFEVRAVEKYSKSWNSKIIFIPCISYFVRNIIPGTYQYSTRYTRYESFIYSLSSCTNGQMRHNYLTTNSTHERTHLFVEEGMTEESYTCYPRYGRSTAVPGTWQYLVQQPAAAAAAAAAQACRCSFCRPLTAAASDTKYWVWNTKYVMKYVPFRADYILHTQSNMNTTLPREAAAIMPPACKSKNSGYELEHDWPICSCWWPQSSYFPYY